MSNGTLRIAGHVRITAFEDGVERLVDEGDNLIVDSGLDCIAKLLAGANGYGPMNAITPGTSGTWPSPPGSLAMITYPSGTIGNYLTASSASYSVPSSGQYQVTFTSTWPNADNNFTIAEIGIFAIGNPTNASQGNQTLFARYVLTTPYVKTASQQLTIQYTLGFTAS